MILTDLDKRAELTVWPSRSAAHSAQARAFPTLREALAVAAAAIADDARPWIITEDGDILSPGWIRANAAARPLQ